MAESVEARHVGVQARGVGGCERGGGVRVLHNGAGGAGAAAPAGQEQGEEGEQREHDEGGTR